MLTGCIDIRGAWTGSVRVHCPARLVSEAAQTIFVLPAGAVGSELVQDTLGELTNIIGGNLKALLGGACRLGLPAVVEASAKEKSASNALVCVAFQTRGMPLVVEVCPSPRQGDGTCQCLVLATPPRQ
jgi:chemotaxis protein CheX